MTKEEILAGAEEIINDVSISSANGITSIYLPEDILALVDKAILSGYKPDSPDEEKTIKEWFETIPDSKIRRRALRNLELCPILWVKEAKHESLKDAIVIGFHWSQTPEKRGYWEDYYNSLTHPYKNI